MKKNSGMFGLILMIICLVSCDTEDKTESKQVVLTPPAWILGTWKSADDSMSYTFSANNIIYEFEDEDILGKTDFSNDVNVKGQTVSDAEYVVSYNAMGNTYILEFIKTSETELNYFMTLNGNKLSEDIAVGFMKESGTVKLAPPAWILGTWKTSFNNTYTFTADNIIENESSASKKDFSNDIEPKAQTISDTEYTVSYKSNSLIYKLTFTKKTETEFDYLLTLSGNKITTNSYVKQVTE